MGLERSLKVTLVVPKEKCEAVLEELRDLSILQLEDISEKETGGEDIGDLEQLIARARFVQKTLSPYRKKKRLLALLEDERIELSREEFLKRAKSVNIQKIYSEVSALEQEILAAENDLGETEKLIKLYSNFLDLKISLSDLLPTERTKHRFQVYLFLLKLDEKKRLEASKDIELAEFFPLTYGVGKGRREIPYAAICHVKAKEEVEKLIKQVSETLVEVPEGVEVDKSIKDFVIELEKKRNEILEKIDKLKERLASYAVYISDVEVALDYYESELKRKREKRYAVETLKTTLFSGWVLENDVEKFQEFLRSRPYIHADIFEPENWNESPVRLKNSPWTRPMEFITELYGYPSANEVDPTPLFSPWFLIFFGLCINDAGYGLILATSGFLVMKYLKLKKMLSGFAHIALWGGIASFISGVLTASYFSIDTKLLPKFLLSLRVMDPLNDVTIYLVLSLLLGIVHLLIGIVTGIYNRVKAEKSVVPVLEESGKIFLFVGATGWAASYLSNYKGIFGVIGSVSEKFLIIGVVLTILFSAGLRTRFIRRVFSGLYNLYGMSSYVGDVISYARLMALGLSSGLIGMAINVLAGISIDMLGYIVGGIVAVLILILGHIFNLVMSLIGSFVHPLRLQYVEFFKQFYVDGGKPFRPLSWQEKYVKLVEERR